MPKSFNDDNGRDTAANITDEEEESRNSIYFSSNEEEFEDEDAYRLRVYGTTNFEENNPLKSTSTTPETDIETETGAARRLSKRVSRELYRRRSSVSEQLPDTPQGWTVLLSAIGVVMLGYEINLQKSLTKPPITFGQLPEGSVIANVYKKMSANNDSILSRTIQPSLFVGTRGILASTAAYLLGGPSTKSEHVCFREIVTSSQDGATLGIDWEVPLDDKFSKQRLSPEQRKEKILKGPIHNPVVIILHGINNDASFGYIQSLMRTFADRGWNSAAMNFRGCGGVQLATPRGYNASYTGDLRNLVLQISSRLSGDTPIFLVGNSLGANVMTKYLGEEGRSGTLPQCVAGGVSLGNPLLINSSIVSFPFNIFMAMGVKKYCLHNLASLRGMKDANSRHRLAKTFLATTIANFDRSLAGLMIRNETKYPFAFKIGYESGEAYWMDASSYRYVKDISVPFLNVSSEDDFLVSKPSRNRLGFCIGNPNVMVVETRCGGHLGWQESPPETDSAFGSVSWADSATADFFDSVIKSNVEMFGTRTGKQQRLGQTIEEVDTNVRLLLQGGPPASNLTSKL